MIMEQELGGSDVNGRHAGWLTHFSSQKDEVMLLPLIHICLSHRLL